KRSRLEENAAATRITLTESELAALEPIASLVTGDRYPDMRFTSVSREVTDASGTPAPGTS
ncbi:hypothetical protein ACFW89_38435, partial [Streptomyces albidoflavus]